MNKKYEIYYCQRATAYVINRNDRYNNTVIYGPIVTKKIAEIILPEEINPDNIDIWDMCNARCWYNGDWRNMEEYEGYNMKFFNKEWFSGVCNDDIFYKSKNCKYRVAMSSGWKYFYGRRAAMDEIAKHTWLNIDDKPSLSAKQFEDKLKELKKSGIEYKCHKTL